jgi:ferredoxin-type protein NapF
VNAPDGFHGDAAEIVTTCAGTIASADQSRSTIDDAALLAVPSHGAWRERQRWLVRCACLAAAVVALLPAASQTPAPLIVPALSPFVAVGAVLATWTVSLATGWGLAVGAIAVFRGRWFCRWACPTGLCADAAGRWALRWGRRCPPVPTAGPWLALLTWGGACLGYPLLLWLDPLALFAGLFRVATPAPEPLSWCCALGVPAVVLLSCLWPGLWCARLCPLGATQDLLRGSLAGRVNSRSGAFFGQTARPSLGSQIPGGPARTWPTQVPRRTLLGLACGAVWAATVRIAHGDTPRTLRPPGAQDELRFLGLCLRCGNCSRGCPAHIIRPDGGQRGLAGLFAPVLDFRDDYCREDCTRCLNVCPSGALKPLALEDKRRSVIGQPHVDMDVCLLGNDRDCAVCRNRCPFEALVLVFSETDYTLTPQIDPHKCNGCGACEAACPTQPVKAIVVRPQVSEAA